jgi:ankyrin repeat protein
MPCVSFCIMLRDFYLHISIYLIHVSVPIRCAPHVFKHIVHCSYHRVHCYMAAWQAVASNNRDHLLHLIENDTNINQKGFFGLMSLAPVQLAQVTDRTELMFLLVSNGAKTDYEDRFGRILLQYAVYHAKLDQVQMLIGCGVNVNAVGRGGKTAMHTVGQGYPFNIDIMDTLIIAGANVNAMDDDGDTPLHQAVVLYDDSFARALICRGADLMASNKLGQTPADIARLRNKFAIALEIENIIHTRETERKNVCHAFAAGLYKPQSVSLVNRLTQDIVANILQVAQERTTK